MSMGPKDKTKDLGDNNAKCKIKCGSDLRLLGLTIEPKPGFQ